MKYVIVDQTNNTGRDYIGANGINVALSENAIEFDNIDNANEFLKNHFDNYQEWAIIVEK